LRAVGSLVGVAGLDHVEEVVVLAVAGLLGLQGALTARVLVERMAVAIVTEDRLNLHLVAVDRAVLGVGGGHLELHLVTELEEVAVRREVHRDGGTGVARADLDAGGGGLAAGGRDGQDHVVVAALLVGVGGVGVGGVGVAVAAKVLRERERLAGRVPAALAGERDGHRQRSVRLVRRGASDRRAGALGVLDPVDAGVGVVPAAAGALL